MSRARERREAALRKRQVPEDDTDEDEQFDWMDVEQPDDMYAGEDLEGDGQ